MAAKSISTIFNLKTKLSRLLQNASFYKSLHFALRIIFRGI